MADLGCVHLGPKGQTKSWDDAREYCKELRADLFTGVGGTVMGAVANYIDNKYTPARKCLKFSVQFLFRVETLSVLFM